MITMGSRAKRRQASCQSVRVGRVWSCNAALDGEGPVTGALLSILDTWVEEDIKDINHQIEKDVDSLNHDHGHPP